MRKTRLLSYRDLRQIGLAQNLSLKLKEMGKSSNNRMNAPIKGWHQKMVLRKSKYLNVMSAICQK